MENKVKEILNNIRPYLQSDGGDIEFVKVEDNIVYIKMYGSCSSCPFRNGVTKNNILNSLQEQIPEIKDVIIVEI